MPNLFYGICALNRLGKVDRNFFIICAVIVAVIIAVYFLIPVLNKKQYKEQRDNLHKREAAFKSNIDNKKHSEDEAEDVADDTKETSVINDLE